MTLPNQRLHPTAAAGLGRRELITTAAAAGEPQTFGE
jgi:hypothetical protein